MARILVVDDDPDSQEMLRIILESGGHEVTQAYAGDKALALAAGTPPDLIVMDVMMNHETDGLETVYRLRADSRYEAIRQTPVVLFTNTERVRPFVTSDGTKVKSLEVQAFVRKPVVPQAFLKLVAELTG